MLGPIFDCEDDTEFFISGKILLHKETGIHNRGYAFRIGRVNLMMTMKNVFQMKYLINSTKTLEEKRFGR